MDRLGMTNSGVEGVTPMSADQGAAQTTAERVQDACLRYHGWTREDAPKGAVHTQEQCKFCEGYACGLDAQATRERELEAALEALLDGQVCFVIEGDSLNHDPPRDDCEVCIARALLAGSTRLGQPVAQDEVARLREDLRALAAECHGTIAMHLGEAMDWDAARLCRRHLGLPQELSAYRALSGEAERR